MKNFKRLCGFMMAAVMIMSMAACSSKTDSSSSSTSNSSSQSESSTNNDSTSNVKLNTEGYTPYRIIVDDSLKEKSLPEQINAETDADGNPVPVIPESLYENSALAYVRYGFVTEQEDLDAANGNVKDGSEIFIISSDPENNLCEFNDLKTNEDFSETTITEHATDKDRSVTVKTALNYKGELYIVMDDNVAAIQEKIV